NVGQRSARLFRSHARRKFHAANEAGGTARVENAFSLSAVARVPARRRLAETRAPCERDGASLWTSAGAAARYSHFPSARGQCGIRASAAAGDRRSLGARLAIL